MTTSLDDPSCEPATLGPTVATGGVRAGRCAPYSTGAQGTPSTVEEWEFLSATQVYRPEDTIDRINSIGGDAATGGVNMQKSRTRAVVVSLVI